MTQLIGAQNISRTYGAVTALDDVSLTVRQGESICVLGPSGAGKSTLLRCLNLLEYIDSGSIVYGGHPVIDAGNGTGNGNGNGATGRRRRRLHVRPDRFRRKFGFVFHHDNLFPHRTVIENMIEGAVYAGRRRRRDALDEAAELLAAVGLGEHARRAPGALTLAQRHRVALARALMMKPEVLLIDEITSELYPAQVVALQEIVRNLRRVHGAAMVVITHHIEFARRVADRICFMEGGRIVEEGPASILQEPRTAALGKYLQVVRSAR